MQLLIFSRRYHIRSFECSSRPKSIEFVSTERRRSRHALTVSDDENAIGHAGIEVGNDYLRVRDTRIVGVRDASSDGSARLLSHSSRHTEYKKGASQSLQHFPKPPLTIHPGSPAPSPGAASGGEVYHNGPGA